MELEIKKEKDVLIKVSSETRKKLKIEASKRDLSIKDFVEKMIDGLINKGLRDGK